MKKIFFLIIFLCYVTESYSQDNRHIISNPVIKGYYADPSVLKVDNIYYIYVTKDPWGGDELAVFETKDFKTFDPKHINWPTKLACTSPTSKESMVWAPSVVKAKNGKFYMYVSVGSEVWVGVSEKPLGPWQNAKADKTPLIKADLFPAYHMIDAECFIELNGQAYLYWGSGLNWVNGHCFVVKLKPDMVTFEGDPKDITPPNYFEAPFMFKKNDVYYLMYSEGKAIDDTYKIRYSIGKTPFGPWEEGINSPILSTTDDRTTIGPGHHSIFLENGQYYILYHRIHPQEKEYVLREICIDSLNFDKNDNIKKIQPKGVTEFKVR